MIDGIKKKQNIQTNNKFLADIIRIISQAKTNAIRSVDFERVIMYWKLGERIFVEEQQGKKRAEYGTYLLKNLAEKLEPQFGSGFSYRQLARARQFYRTYPIVSALRTQFNWMQYKLLIHIDNPDKREYYELETLHNSWNGRELERQINSNLYERLLLSNDKKSVLAVARKKKIPENPNEIIKEPVILEFLGLKKESTYYEKDLEIAIINNLQEFLLELGNGFSFVARQKRILLEDDEFFIDLVFYNPGKLYGGITVQDLLSGNYVSKSRNKLIARAFKAANVIERYGSGIMRIHKICKDYGVKEPNFEEISSGFQVILYNEKINVTDSNIDRAKKIIKNNTENNTEKGTEKGTEKVSINQQKIIKNLLENPSITSEELSVIIGIRADKIRINLSKLKSKGLIERVGADKGGYWKVKT